MQPEGVTAACLSSARERVTVMVMGCLLMECEVNKGEEKGVEEVDRSCMEGIWCENKRRGLQTVEPTMVC